MTWQPNYLVTRSLISTASRKAPFFQYTRNVAIYKCPADNYVSAQQRAAGIKSRPRSYSMNCFFGAMYLLKDYPPGTFMASILSQQSLPRLSPVFNQRPVFAIRHDFLSFWMNTRTASTTAFYKPIPIRTYAVEPSAIGMICQPRITPAPVASPMRMDIQKSTPGKAKSAPFYP